MPPDFFSRARRRPPKKILAARGGHRPERMMLIKPVHADKNSAPPTLQRASVFKCKGLNPSGPPEEPAGKLKMAFFTISSDADNASAGSGRISVAASSVYYY